MAPRNGPAAESDVQLDYVGNLENAALVLSRLHRGEKRLVFCDSRSRAEELAARLRAVSGANVRIAQLTKRGLTLASGTSVQHRFGLCHRCDQHPRTWAST